MKTLFADGGSTKTSWCLLNNNVVTTFYTEGYHPFFVDVDYIQSSLKKNIPLDVQQLGNDIKKIWFYSAGGGYSERADKILIDGLSDMFPNATIAIETDLLAAARALLRHDAGFSAILGTGSNTCLYNGEKITGNIESLGFLIGDEGSGAYMGKILISDYIRGYMPNEVKNLLSERFHLTPDMALNQLYESKFSNRYCAKFAIFIREYIEYEYLMNIAVSNFDDFFKNIVSHYTAYESYTFNAVGSVAFHFEEIIKRVAHKYNMKISKIALSAIDGLIEYHLNSDL